jgi:hypothetical protein
MTVRARPRLPRIFAAALGAVVPLLAAACDSAPGAPAMIPEAPALAGFDVAPDSFFLPGDAPAATIPVALSGSVTNPAGGSVTVHYVIRRQGDDAPALEGEHEVEAAGSFQASADLVLPRGASGLYAVEAVAVGRDGRAGGRASGVLRFTIEPLGPPSIVAVALDPAVVTVPATGAAQLRIVATVTDPDGLLNIGYVALQPAGGGGTFPLSDGGPLGQTGDATAGDGLYTVTLQVGAGTPPGQFPFEVVARDREGLDAAAFPVTITIQ